jgi:D-alanine-D-alanine ligase
MKLNVGVLFGGNSVEHEVSIISASQAMAAFDAERYHVVPLYLSKDNQLYSGPQLLDVKQFKDLNAIQKKVPQVTLYKEKQNIFVQSIKALPWQKAQRIDVVVPVVHGTHCEDGSVQGYLETMGIPYAGSDVIGAALGQDKIFMKMAFAYHDLPMVPWLYFDVKAYQDDKTSQVHKIADLGYPVVVKPARLGSSVGISFVNSEDELDEAITTALQYDMRVIIEKAVENLREVNCSVLGDELHAQASVLEEVMKGDAILSYKDKYQGSSKSKGMASTSRICPAELDAATTKKIQDLSLQSFNVLGCAGVVRIDFMMDAKTNAIYINEVNTIPGSLAFYLWEKSGLGFSDLMDALVDQAINRTRRKAKMIFSFETNLLEGYGSKGSKAVKR